MRWAGIAAVIVAYEYLVAVLIGTAIGFAYEIPIMRLLTAGFGVVVIGLLGFAFIKVALFAWQREPKPLHRLWCDLAEASDFPIVVFLAASQMAVLAWLKVTMPRAVGFWADHLLADLDAAIFGVDPWIWLHMLPDWVGTLVDQFYVTWGFVTIAALIALAFAPKGLRRDQALLTYFLLICISALFQYLLPSAGPVFYEAVGHGSRFADLPIRPWAQATGDYLWSNYNGQNERLGAGISAMPSIHVAGAAWLALSFGAYFPRLKLLGWAYFAVILLGSVYLGWHYALDGIAGLAIAIFSWASSGQLLLSRFQRDRTGWTPSRPISGA